MIKPIALDSGPRGALAQPRRNTDIAAWLDGVLAAGVVVYLPEIIDYDVLCLLTRYPNARTWFVRIGPLAYE